MVLCVKRELSKYEQLVAYLHQKISQGEYKPGDRIESEHQLAARFGYSRQTVRQALSTLESEGMLVRRRGSGTYVSGTASSRQTKNIGVITTYISDYIFPAIIRGIERELAEHGYGMMLGATLNRVENENRLLRSMEEKGVDGLIVEAIKSALPNPNLELYRRLERSGIPVVFFNAYYRELTDCTYVVTDDVRAGADAVGYLLQRGCRKLGGIFKSDDMQGHRRYEGMMKAALPAGALVRDDAVVWFSTADDPFLFEGESGRRLFERLAGCDGVVCYNDTIAYRLIEALQLWGKRVPEDVSVIGFDNSGIAQYGTLHLTTMNHPKEEMGTQAARMILHMAQTGIREKPVVMKMQPVLGDTVR